MGISCYAGCGSDVVGLCQGHTRRCGRFYCSGHSFDRLCEDCASDLSCQNEADQRYGPYADAARLVVLARRADGVWQRRAVIVAALFVAAFAVQISGVATTAVPGNLRALVLLAIASGAAAAFLFARNARLREQDVRRMYGGEPGFDEFLPRWERLWYERAGDERAMARDRDRLVAVVAAALSHSAPVEPRPVLELVTEAPAPARETRPAADGTTPPTTGDTSSP